MGQSLNDPVNKLADKVTPEMLQKMKELMINPYAPVKKDAGKTKC